MGSYFQISQVIQVSSIAVFINIISIQLFYVLWFYSTDSHNNGSNGLFFYTGQQIRIL